VAVTRLKRRAEFLRVAAARRKWAAPGLVLQAAKASDAALKSGEASEEAFRVGFTVSRKVGNSVARNRARRRLREAAEQVMPQQAAPGWDYVLIGRQETLVRPFDALLKDLRYALKKVGALRDIKTPQPNGDLTR
jgi:ribonuclease P protein component